MAFPAAHHKPITCLINEPGYQPMPGLLAWNSFTCGLTNALASSLCKQWSPNLIPCCQQH
eukprot:scaffold118697_cov21-Tisochrysis_lutea.AAC.6